MHTVDLTPEEQDKIIDIVFNDVDLKDRVLRLVSKKRMYGTAEVLNQYGWYEMVRLHLVVISDEPHLETCRYTLEPTDLAMRVAQTHQVESSLDGPGATARW